MYTKPTEALQIDPKDIPPPRVLPNGRHLVTQQQRAFMKALYEEKGLSTWKIASVMGYLNVCVINNLKKAGVQLRSRSDAAKIIAVDRDYFKDIDTHTKAYLLGLFYADGNIHKDSFTIALQERDKHLVESISSELRMAGNLSMRPPKGVTKQNAWVLRIHDKGFCSHLRRWGVVPRKTSTLAYPAFLRHDFFYSFIHGLLDGDGCVSICRNRLVANIAGSPQITLDIKDHLNRRLGINAVRSTPRYSKGTSLNINGVNAIRFLGEMYLNSHVPFCLNRKKETFVRYLRHRVSTPITHSTQEASLHLSIKYLKALA